MGRYLKFMANKKEKYWTSSVSSPNTDFSYISTKETTGDTDGDLTVSGNVKTNTITIGEASFIDIEIDDLTYKEFKELVKGKLNISISKEQIKTLSPELKKKVIAKGIIDKL
jgi:hypothetical protein|tara:strand:+ start:1681 stop:2016 length:336 start_codon:yes stop_codon:yes gene_type:complete